jgi:tRNA (guanine9-N1)-methyltransferase
MESEERPAKMRKLNHGEEEGAQSLALSSGNGDNITSNNAPSYEKPSAENDQNGQEDDSNDQEVDPLAAVEAPTPDEATPKISKNQLKKQRRLEKWESGREDRKVKRKEKIQARKERKREAWREDHAKGDGEAADGAANPKGPRDTRPKAQEGTHVPITVIFDCDFDDMMYEQELKSLGLQLTRCYADNRKAPFQTHLAISSFGGKLKERFDGILAKQYTSWKSVQFFSEDFVAVAEKAKEWMSGDKRGTVAGALAEGAIASSEEEGEIVYLSSESDEVLERLKPNSTYIIGGLVDKNRHKGICHKRAVNRNIRTAKLPIGQFLEMKSRQVLATNHVLEIMLKWLEFGNWGKAFMEVIPKRKGGVLKGEHREAAPDDNDAGAGEEETPNTESPVDKTGLDENA